MLEDCCFDRVVSSTTIVDKPLNARDCDVDEARQLFILLEFYFASVPDIGGIAGAIVDASTSDPSLPV